MRNQIRVAPIRFDDPDHTVLYFSSFLTGAAGDWFTQQHDQEGTLPEGYDVDTLLEGLSEAFGDIPSNLTKERQLRELKQTRAVQDFTAKFRTLVRQFQGWEDHPMIFTYFERLKSEVRQEILKVQTPPETFSEYVTFVKNIENALSAARLDKPFRATYIPS